MWSKMKQIHQVVYEIFEKPQLGWGTPFQLQKILPVLIVLCSWQQAKSFWKSQLMYLSNAICFIKLSVILFEIQPHSCS